MITVGRILDLLLEIGKIQIYVAGETYEFNTEEIPEEIMYMEIDSIDNPYFYSEVHPLCLNISSEKFDDYKAFMKEFESYII